jgi:hypothetical protein
MNKNKIDKKINTDKSKGSFRENYPTSVNNQKCIGPCYYSNTRIIHPLTLDEIRGVEHNFCPVNTFVFTDPQTKQSRLSIIDKCVVPTARETQMDEILRDNVIAPQFQFSSDYFVKVYYKINNLEDLLNWLDGHKTDPFKTKERVFNNSMVVYGNQLNIVDHRMIYFINDLMIENLPKLYRHLKQYFLVNDDVITLIDPSAIPPNVNDQKNDNQTKDDQIKKIPFIRSYIKEKFLGNDNIHQFMSKIIRYYKEDITDRYISNVLVNYMIDYIVKRIKLTLDQDAKS